MSDYIGKICPFCKTPFRAGDDIVVCSDCEMPHHKDCWVDNQGCTTFGCSGTIKSPDTVPSDDDFEIILYDDENRPKNQNETNQNESVSEYIYCTRCGNRNHITHSFCNKCGNPLTKAAKQTPSRNNASAAPESNQYGYGQPANHAGYGNISYADRKQNNSNDSAARANIAMLVGKNVQYYLPRFNQMSTNNTKSGWNWSAFMFGPLWMIYRKMYAYGFAVLGGMLLLSIFGDVIVSLIAPAVYIVSGILGNYIYMKELEKKELQMKNLTESDKADFSLRNGGTNTSVTVLAAFGYVVLDVIILLI